MIWSNALWGGGLNDYTCLRYTFLIPEAPQREEIFHEVRERATQAEWLLGKPLVLSPLRE